MNQDKFIKNETLLQTLKRLNKQIKTEQKNNKKNQACEKITNNEKTSDNDQLIYQNDESTSYQSMDFSTKSYEKKNNIDTNSILSLDNDENSMMFIKIISNLEERLNELENKKKRKEKNLVQ